MSSKPVQAARFSLRRLSQRKLESARAEADGAKGSQSNVSTGEPAATATAAGTTAATSGGTSDATGTGSDSNTTIRSGAL